MTNDQEYPAHALLGPTLLTNADIRGAELARARHALAYLKGKLGNEALRALLREDLAATAAQVRGWVAASAGAWQTGAVELVVPGPPAVAFHAWYTRAMADDREAALRAGHPEHFVSHPQAAGTIEVIENIGETELPWQVFYHSLPDDDPAFPAPWEAGYAVRFGMELLDSNGLRFGFSMHQLRDAADGLHLKLTTYLPAALPPALVPHHLHHFAIEFRNWTRAAWLEAQSAAEAA